MTGKKGKPYVADHRYDMVYKPETSIKPYAKPLDSHGQGWKARYENVPLKDNPFTKLMPARRWVQGWLACDDMLKSKGLT